MFYTLFNTKIEFRITIVYFKYNMTCFKQCSFHSVFPFHVLVTPSKRSSVKRKKGHTVFNNKKIQIITCPIYFIKTAPCTWSILYHTLRPSVGCLRLIYNFVSHPAVLSRMSQIDIQFCNTPCGPWSDISDWYTILYHTQRSSVWCGCDTKLTMIYFL